jgi:hypothetical protein
MLVIRDRLIFARERVIPNDPIVIESTEDVSSHDRFRTMRRGFLSKPDAGRLPKAADVRSRHAPF